MSLIAGLVAKNATPPQHDPGAMLERMALYPPDADRVWTDQRARLGHALFAHTPEDNFERQPLATADGRFVLAADARLDNRSELLATFQIEESVSPQTPDSVLILRAWLKWGTECPKYLLGDFAFVVWDSVERRLFCARDHMGVRPFYYHCTEHFFAFASAIKGLLVLPEVPHKVNETALADHLVLLEEDKESTSYQDIHRLPPAHTLSVDAWGRVRLNCYWQLDPERGVSFQSSGDCYEAVREALTRAVVRRMRSQHPSAVMLSGGLDSSSIACLAARHLAPKSERLTAVGSVLADDFSGAEQDERHYMQFVVDQASNIDLIGVTAPGASPLTGLDETLHIQDGPFRDAFHYMTTALFKAARERGARNLLSGFGGDHLVSNNARGYLAELARTGRWLKMAHEARARAHVSKHSQWQIIRGQIISPFMPTFVDDAYRRFKRQPLRRWIDEFAIHPDFVKTSGLADRLRQRNLYHGPSRDKSTREGEYRNIVTGSNTRALEYFAHAGAAYGLQVHTPMFDKELVELCLAIPTHFKTGGGWGRLLLRRSMDDILPAEIQWRPDKLPFSPDFDRRITAARGEMHAWLEGIENDAVIASYLDLAKMRRAIETRPDYQSGFSASTTTLGNLTLPLIVAAWLKSQ